MTQHTDTHLGPPLGVKTPWVSRPGELFERHLGLLAPLPALTLIVRRQFA